MTSRPLRRKQRPSEGDLLTLSSLNLQPYQLVCRLPSFSCLAETLSPDRPPPQLTTPPSSGCHGVHVLREPREPVSSPSSPRTPCFPTSMKRGQVSPILKTSRTFLDPSSQGSFPAAEGRGGDIFPRWAPSSPPLPLHPCSWLPYSWPLLPYDQTPLAQPVFPGPLHSSRPCYRLLLGSAVSSASLFLRMTLDSSSLPISEQHPTPSFSLFRQVSNLNVLASPAATILVHGPPPLARTPTATSTLHTAAQTDLVCSQSVPCCCRIWNPTTQLIM